MARMKWVTLAFLLSLIAVAPGLALDRVAPGFDTWQTPGNGRTFTDFSFDPIPAGFFCPSSAPFAGKVVFQGRPIAGLGNQDTLVERLDEAVFDGSGKALTRVRLRALQLEGVAPVRTACGDFNVRVHLVGEQPVTTMRIQKAEENRGWFNSRIGVNARLTFAPVNGVGPVRTLDQHVLFDRTFGSPWTADPAAVGQKTPVTIDTNGDGKLDTQVTLTGGFSAGGDTRSSCGAGFFQDTLDHCTDAACHGFC